MSLLDTEPHEVAQVVIHTGKERFLSSVIHGRRQSVSRRMVYDLVDHSLSQVYALSSAPRIEEVEIVAHPSGRQSASSKQFPTRAGDR